MSFDDNYVLRNTDSIDLSKVEWWKFSDFSEVISVIRHFTRDEALEALVQLELPWVIQEQDKLRDAFSALMKGGINSSVIIDFITYMFPSYSPILSERIRNIQYPEWRNMPDIKQFRHILQLIVRVGFANVHNFSISIKGQEWVVHIMKFEIDAFKELPEQERYINIDWFFNWFEKAISDSINMLDTDRDEYIYFSCSWLPLFTQDDTVVIEPEAYRS